ncbi:MAG: hypothetical protein LC790_07465, partial [Actinobacteria bacterium]|nr:hypothetical protein [Actinomycetota bacterium]
STPDDGPGADGVLVLRPGAQPLTALAAQLASLGSGASMQATLAGLDEDERSLHLCVELALANAPAQRRVVLVVDQLEELFTLCGDERQRERFVAVVLYAATVHGGRALVVVTMRGDFYERCAAYPDLAQLIATQRCWSVR